MSKPIEQTSKPKPFDSYNLNYMRNLGASEERPYWDHCNKEQATHCTHSLLVYGDYCNTGKVGQANVQTILNDSKMCERLGLWEAHEMYNTNSLIIPIAALLDDEFTDILKALDNYPCIDEDLLYQLESEAKEECWDRFGRKDFARFLYEMFSEREDLELDDDKLDSLFAELNGHTNYDIFSMEGDAGYFDFNGLGGLSRKRAKEILEGLL